MKNLFVISRSPYMRNEVFSTLDLAQKDDSVIFIQDGVFIGEHKPVWLRDWFDKAKERGVKFYILKEDCDARSVKSGNDFIVVDYDGFADLLVSHKRAIT